MMVQTSNVLFYLPSHKGVEPAMQTNGNSSTVVHLEETLTAMLNGSTMESDDAFGLSFLTEKDSKIMSELKKREGERIYSFDNNLCKFVSFFSISSFAFNIFIKFFLWHKALKFGFIDSTDLLSSLIRGTAFFI